MTENVSNFHQPSCIVAVPFFTTRTDTASASVTYQGFAEAGADESSSVWFITKQELSGTVLSVKFANGKRSFDQAWNSRTSLTYL